jgi:hypothetical protein
MGAASFLLYCMGIAIVLMALAVFIGAFRD